MPPDADTGLLGLQRALARVIRATTPARDDATAAHPQFVAHAPPSVDGRLDAYRNNAWQFFRGALELTYPVLRLRVGPDYFGQLAREYRARHPSRSGDLHWAGRHFPAWLSSHLADTDYAWLADLARLEWACEEAAVASSEPALPLAAMATIAPEALADTTLGWQPSLRLVASPWPVWSVWQANQDEVPGSPVDLQGGAEHVACACTGERVVTYRLDPDDYRLLDALHRGASLAQALERSDAGPDVLQRVLAWAFGAGLVVALNPSARA